MISHLQFTTTTCAAIIHLHWWATLGNNNVIKLSRSTQPNKVDIPSKLGFQRSLCSSGLLECCQHLRPIFHPYKLITGIFNLCKVQELFTISRIFECLEYSQSWALLGNCYSMSPMLIPWYVHHCMCILFAPLYKNVTTFQAHTYI